MLVGYDGAERVSDAASEIGKRFGVECGVGGRRDDARRAELLSDAEAVFCAGRAGVQILQRGRSAAARRACLSPPTSTPCRRPASRGWACKRTTSPIAGPKALGIGALAIGKIKYQTEFGLFRR